MTSDINAAARRAADLLIEQRGHIDNLDAILIYTLAERFKGDPDRWQAEGGT